MQTTQGAIRGSLWVRKPSVVDEDRTTLVRVASGEESALEDIYARFGPALFGYLLTLTPDRQLAEEILQDTLVAVWRSARTYGGRSSVKTWLFGVARRQAQNTLRRRVPVFAGEGELDVVPAPDPGPEEALLRGSHREELAQRIGSLSPLHREVLALIFFHELTYEETAEILEVPVGTVKSRLSNAKRSLRATMQQPEEDR